MDHAFWRKRWQDNQIGFHEGKPNAFLVRHGAWLADCRRALVPLCGKSVDLVYLAGQGHDVVGVELVEDAVRQFFAEQAIEPEVTQAGSMKRYAAGAITVLAGDIFATTPELVGTIDGIFDRAALVALPPDMRSRYVAQLRAVAPHARRELLVALEYPAGAMEGPPFSVVETEVRSLFAGRKVELVDEQPDVRGRAGGKMIERCYTIELSESGA